MTHFQTALFFAFLVLQWGCGGAAASRDVHSPSALSEKAAEPPRTPDSSDSGRAPSTLDAARFSAQSVEEEARAVETEGSDQNAATDASSGPEPASNASADATADATPDTSGRATDETSDDATEKDSENVEGEAAAADGEAETDGTEEPAAETPVLRAVNASVHLQVESLETARATVRDLVDRVGGHVSREQASIESWQKRATITLRVPVERTEEVLAAAEKLGRLTHREVAVQDITKEYFDARLRLDSLRATLERYEELLAQADGVEQMLLLEKERSRIELDIETLEGTLAYLKDRGQKSTIELSLVQTTEDDLADPDPEARFFPGARLGGAFDLWRPGDGNGDDLQTLGYLDVGLSLGFDRQFSLDVDLLLDPARSEAGIDGGVVTLGGHFYSEFLGDGEATWMEPSIGLRGGYALIAGRHEFTAGAALGIDVYKNDLVRLVLDQRFSVLAGGKGVHALYQPTLGLSVGF